MKLSGHFAVWNSPAEIRSAREGHFIETVAPGAFRKTMVEGRDRIRVLLAHGSDPQLGDKPLGPISELREDSVGAFYEVGLLEGIPELLVAGLREGLYGASFRFEALREDFTERPGRSEHNPDGIPERVLREVRLHEFGPTPFGAYQAATASVRSAGDAIQLRALAGREEVVPARLAPGHAPVTLRRLRASRSTRARELLRELEAGAKVEITWGSAGGSLGRVVTRRKRTGSRDYLPRLPASRDYLPRSTSKRWRL